MPDKETQIQELIRDDYPLPLLQELIAEMVISTQHKNKAEPKKRFEKIMKALLGTSDPTLKNDFTGSKNDNFTLGRLAILANRPLPGKSEPMGTGQAAWEIAREKYMTGYKIGDPMPEMSDGENAEVTAYASRLKEKIDGNEAHYIKLYHHNELETQLMLETDHEEIELIESLMSSWLKRYGRQLSFSSKND